jgi:hypothetical protein
MHRRPRPRGWQTALWLGILCFASLGGAAAAAGKKPGVRAWRVKTPEGRKTVRGTLLDYAGGKVRIRQTDGQVLTIPFKQLGSFEQWYVKKHAAPASGSTPGGGTTPATVGGKPTLLGSLVCPVGAASTVELPREASLHARSFDATRVRFSLNGASGGLKETWDRYRIEKGMRPLVVVFDAGEKPKTPAYVCAQWFSVVARGRSFTCLGSDGQAAWRSAPLATKGFQGSHLSRNDLAACIRLSQKDVEARLRKLDTIYLAEYSQIYKTAQRHRRLLFRIPTGVREVEIRYHPPGERVRSCKARLF